MDPLVLLKKNYIKVNKKRFLQWYMAFDYIPRKI